VLDEDEARGNSYSRSLLARLDTGDQLVLWSLRTSCVDAVSARFGLSVESRSRVRPDGVRLSWRPLGSSSHSPIPGCRSSCNGTCLRTSRGGRRRPTCSAPPVWRGWS
jgi:hypothetical protein